jgi:serpin B
MKQKTIAIWALAAAILLCVIVLSGCTGIPGKNNTPAVPATVPATPDVTPGAGDAVNVSEYAKSVADANNRFAFELYSKLSTDPQYAGRNLFFSPFSISSALAITYEGANGKTADEIQAVFHFPKDNTTRRQGFSDINAGINMNNPAYTLRTANALWAEKTYPFLPEYISIAEQYYGANTTNLDFITRPEPSRITINRWVEERTEEKIKDLLPAGTIDPLTRLVITNAIYFKGDWVKQFDKNKTADADFRTASGKTVRVPMMQRTDEDAVYLYAENDNLQVLSMPYEHKDGKELSMVVLLPKDDDLAAVEASLDADTLSTLRQSETSRRVNVYFPKFTLEAKYPLSPVLKAMGMPTAFTGAADFSGMDGTKNLFITDVFHQAFVDVNEEGTEAAAATAVVVGMGLAPAEPVPVFNADHPFIFVIQDDETGTILFVGRIDDPLGT